MLAKKSAISTNSFLICKQNHETFFLTNLTQTNYYNRAEAYDINPSMFDLSLPEPSEGNLNNKIWGRIIEILFSNSPIEYLRYD
jgi:hypothetical protein